MEILTYIYLFFILIAIYLGSLFLILYYKNKDVLEENRITHIFPTISVLIPAYNEEGTIANTVNAVLDQDYPKNKIEIIAINDGSRDGTLIELKKFGNKIKILDKKNSGKADSLNQALKIAKGELFAVIDADAYPEKKAIKQMVSFFEEKGVSLVTSTILVKNRKKILEYMQAVEYAVIAWTRKLFQYLEGIYVAPGPLSIYKRKQFISYGGFDPENLTEDIEATWKVLSHNKKVRIDLRSKVYTTVPSKLKVWWKQRIRWNLGGFQTMWKYRSTFFNPKHGMMGLFIVPFFLSQFVLSLFGFGVFTYVLSKKVINTYLASKYAIIADSNFLTLSALNLNPNVFAFFAMILLVMGLLYLVYSQSVIENSKIGIKRYYKFAIYLLMYLSLYPLIYINSLWRLIVTRERTW